MKDLNKNEIIRAIYPVSALNETLLRVIRDKVPKQTIVVRTSDEPWFDIRCDLAYRAKLRKYRVLSRSRTQMNWEEYRVACRHAQLVYVDAK